MIKSILRRLAGKPLSPGWLVMEFDGKAVRLAHVRRDQSRPVVEFAEKRQCDPAQPKSLERIASEFDLRRFPGASVREAWEVKEMDGCFGIGHLSVVTCRRYIDGALSASADPPRTGLVLNF